VSLSLGMDLLAPAVLCGNLVATCTQDRHLWIWIWMGNFISTASLHVTLKGKGRVQDVLGCKYLQNRYRQRLSLKGEPIGNGISLIKWSRDGNSRWRRFPLSGCFFYNYYYSI